MPRRARLNLPEVPLHIVQRGNNRQPTFFADDDCAFYLECLRDSALQHACDEPETGLRPHFFQLSGHMIVKSALAAASMKHQQHIYRVS